jgi:hypothetical protein
VGGRRRDRADVRGDRACSSIRFRAREMDEGRIAVHSRPYDKATRVEPLFRMRSPRVEAGRAFGVSRTVGKPSPGAGYRAAGRAAAG